jgi:hypothetical protein
MSTGPDTGDLENAEWAAWYRLTPLERWRESMRLWEYYLSVGGSLDPEPDSQSPFDPDYKLGPVPAYGGTSLRVISRSGI